MRPLYTKFYGAVGGTAEQKAKKIKEKISHTVSIPLRQVIICNWIEKPGSF